MRLSSEERKTIKRLAKSIFGNKTHVYLFGSRTLDTLKGGDIDLFITNEDKQNLTFSAKISFLAELKYLIGEQKIDLILDTEAIQEKHDFYHTIRKQAVEL